MLALGKGWVHITMNNFGEKWECTLEIHRRLTRVITYSSYFCSPWAHCVMEALLWGKHLSFQQKLWQSHVNYFAHFLIRCNLNGNKGVWRGPRRLPSPCPPEFEVIISNAVASNERDGTVDLGPISDFSKSLGNWGSINILSAQNTLALSPFWQAELKWEGGVGVGLNLRKLTKDKVVSPVPSSGHSWQ